MANEDVALANFAGGAYNQNLYWFVLTKPDCADEGPDSDLENKILEGWDIVDDFIAKFNFTLGTIFGSLWAWACVNDDGDIETRKTPNQENFLIDQSDTCYSFLGCNAWDMLIIWII